MCWRGNVVGVKQDLGLVDPYISVFNKVVDVWNLNFGFESTQSLHIGYRVIVFFLQLIQNLKMGSCSMHEGYQTTRVFLCQIAKPKDLST